MAKLTRTPSSNGNQKTWTLSGWYKFAVTENADYQYLLNGYYSNGYRYTLLTYRNSTIECYGGDYQTGSASQMSFDDTTNRLLRDPCQWYHVVISFDTTQSTESDRLKIWINNELQTSFQGYTGSGASATFPAQDDVTFMNVTTTPMSIGESFQGSMSHVHFTDGTTYTPSSFGETDATTGEWKIKTNPTGINYGTNGFWMFKDDNAVNDDSGQGNNFTLASGATIPTKDCPSNSFATFNRLGGADTMAANATFGNGNNTVTCAGTTYNPLGTTLGVNKGKYYAEFKLASAAGDAMVGVFAKYGGASNYLGSQTQQYSWYVTSGGNIKSNSATVSGGASVGTYTTNDIIGIALDCDNNKLYFHKNGVYITFGGYTQNPSAGQYGISITDPADTDLGFYFMTAMDWGGSTRANWHANFGNGYFGTTAVSSAGTSASTPGTFEFDCPTGFQPLSTKGMNSF